MTRTPFVTDAALDRTPFGARRPRGLLARLIGVTRACPPTWSGRRRAFLLRSVALRVLKGRPLDVEALGARMRLYPANNVCEKRILFTPQFFDPRELALLRSRVTDEFVFLDVGANVGGYALALAARAGPRARILAIEPQPEIHDRLIYNIRQNPFGTIKALDCAVADREGDVTLFLDPRNRGRASMRVVALDGPAAQTIVPAKRLATIIGEEGYRRVDALKLDVAGAEDLVLETFFAEAPRTVWPRLLLMDGAGGRWEASLAPMLAARGYREILKTRGNVAYELDA